MRIDLTVVDPDGAARDVAVLAPRGTPWRAVGPRLGAGWWCDGRPVADADVLGAGRLRDGAVLRARPTGSAAAPPAGHRLEVVGGPDAGHGVPLGRAPVTVGRGPNCTLMLHDPLVSRLHARVTVGVRGATVRDCASAGGTFVEAGRVGAAPQPVPVGAYVRVGDTFLCVTGPEPGGRAGAAQAPDVAEIELPRPPGRTVGARLQWAAAVVPGLLGAGLALTMHSAQFLLFALFSPAALLGSAIADRLHRHRDGRRSRSRYRRQVAEVRRRIERHLACEVAARRAADPGPPALLRAAAGGSPGTATDPMIVRLGLADLPSRLIVREPDGARPAGVAHAVPCRVDLADGPLGIAAPQVIARGVARWVIGQLAVHSTPDTVRLRALLSPEAEAAWRWLRWLPHLEGPVAVGAAEHTALLAELAAERNRHRARARGEPWHGPRLVLLLDGPRAADLPGLAELLADEDRLGITAVFVETSGGRLPPGCAAVAAAVGDTGGTLEVRSPGGAQQLVADQVSEAWSDRLARRLSAARTGRDGTHALPVSCSLLELLGLADPTAARLSTRWRDAGTGLHTVLGAAPDGPVHLDLVRDGPHVLVAGTTGSGKSELLRTLVAGLAANHPPEDVGFVLVDYKGGAAFAECAELSHTVGVVTDLDGHLAARALASLECELRRREQVFATVGARDFAAYRAGARGEPLSRLVIVVDEFAELAAELPDFVSGLVGIARRGRSLGVHLVLATQRPAGVVSAEIRANTAVRIALRVTDDGDSRDVIDGPDAAAIDRHHPGRGYLRLPGSAPVPLQTALVSGAAPNRDDGAVRVLELDAWRRPMPTARAGPVPTELQQLVDAVHAAALRDGRAGAARPWLPPLPEAVAMDTLAGTDPHRVPLGLLDLPRGQQQVPFTVDLAAGGTVLFAGGPGSGRTDALRALAVSAATRLAPHRLHVHVIDHAGGGLAGLAALPHCGSLARDDIAVTERLIGRLTDEASRRRAVGVTDRGPALLVLLDGWEQFLAAAEQHAAAGVVEAWLALLRTGPTVGMTLAVAGDRGTLASRLATAMATKLALRLTDRADYALLGLPERSVPTHLPPGRAVRAGDGAELQLAHLGDEPTPPAARGAITQAVARWADAPPGPEPIRVRALPAGVRLRDLVRTVHLAAPATFGPARRSAPVVLGVGGDAAQPLAIDLCAGHARLLVAGPPGSGRTTLLLTLLEQLVGYGTQLSVAAGDWSPLSARARAAGAAVIGPDDEVSGVAEHAAVLLLDDAERFLDRPAGDALTTWAQRRPDAAVVVAGCSDELALTFRGIAAHVRKSRCAVLLDPGPGDGELVGVRLGRARVGGPPGRGVVIGDRAWGPQFGAAPVPVQVAQP
jgi:S-DNA-T family DNA segregation ATPase FtsK/SpoIIIE